MAPEQLAEFRVILQGRLKALLAPVVGQEPEGAVELDLAALASNRESALRVRERERQRLSELREAIDRVEDGSYGTCVVCGGEIPIKRLRARPTTVRCMECPV